MFMTTTPKRFIAGAVCPACQALDRVVLYAVDGVEFCECVQCGCQQMQETENKPVVAKMGKKEHIIRVIRPVKK
jgi:uncharacterized protein